MNFAQMAAVKVDEVPDALPLPRGSYIWAIYKPFEVKATAKETGEMVNFFISCVSAIEDFQNPDDLAEYREKMKTETGEKRIIGFFFPTVVTDKMSGQDDLKKAQDRAMRDIRKFLVSDCGVEVEDGDDINMLCSKAVNHRFLGDVIHEKRQNSDEMMDRVQGTAPLD